MKKIIDQFQKSRLATTILVALVFLAFNWLSYGLYIRFDLSRDGTLRLTAATKKIIRGLSEPVTMEAFFSTDIPDAQIKQVNDLRAFLNEYASASRGKVKLFFLNPDSDEDAKKRATEQGIKSVQAGQIDEKNIGIKQIYLSVLISYGDKKETIGNILQTSVLEYELTTRIYKMAYPNAKKIGFLSNHGSFSLTETQMPFHSFENLNEQITRIYGNIESVDTAAAEIPGDIATLIIATPSSLSDLDKFRIDQFLMKGGNLILTIGGMALNLQQGMASPIDESILEFFKTYGIQIGKDMVVEPKNFISIKQPVNPFQAIEIPYPAWMVAIEDNMNDTNLITKGIPILFLPWTGSVTINQEALKKDGKETAKATILAKSSNQAFSLQNLVIIDPRQMKDSLGQGQQNQNQFNVALEVKGRFRSFFADKPVPKEAPKLYSKESEKEAAIVAVTSPYAFTNFPEGLLQADRQAAQALGINMNFLLSAIDVLNGLEDLATARKSQISDAKVTSMDSWKKKLLTALNFLLPLGGFFTFGLLRLLRRRSLAEKTYEKQS